MSAKVTIQVDGDTAVDVYKERISEDGRERHTTGVNRVEPGESTTVIVGDATSVRVEQAKAS